MRTLVLLLAPAALLAGTGRYARLGEFEGQVEVQLHPADPWMAAERNLPLPESSWIRTGAAARVEIELDDGGVWRLGADSQGEISDYTRLSTAQRVTTLSLDHGVAWFTGQPKDKDALTLAVPGAQVIYFRNASVRLEADDTTSRIAILEGAAKFSCPAAEIDIARGTTVRVAPATPDRFFLDREIVAHELDRWSTARDKAIAANSSGGHVVERYGLADLDTAGEWVSTDQFGTAWKPKDQDHWVPFQNGRWRWYDAIGYTWVSDDVWGWLPYHYGRWARSKDLGWIWIPTLSQVFKPGEVYWMRAPKFVGWGPLGPGEKWTAADQPDQYLNVNTTFATYQPETRTIDPAGFTDRPKEPLQVMTFTAALPSPALAAARLDVTRPVLRAGSTRLIPYLRGVTYEDPVDDPASRPSITASRPRPSQPPAVIVVTQPAPEPEQVAVPVPVPYPVIAGIIAPVAPQQKQQKPQQKPKQTAATQTASTKPVRQPHAEPLPQPAPVKKPRDRGEFEIYSQTVADMDNPAKQLVDLDSWVRRYPESDFADDRAVLYMQAYSKTRHPDKVIEIGGRLMQRDVESLFTDPAQILSVLYLTTLSAGQLPTLNRDQRTVIVTASRELLSYTPHFFNADHKPRNVSDDDWENARKYMESAAKNVLAMNRH